jgi:hypothetical protein
MISIFLSHARNDDEEFVRRLHAELTSAGFDVWFDHVSMPSRQIIFHQERFYRLWHGIGLNGNPRNAKHAPLPTELVV